MPQALGFFLKIEKWILLGLAWIDQNNA